LLIVRSRVSWTRRVPSVSFGATNLLHHWQQQDPSLASKRKCLAPAASVVQTGHTHPQKYLQHPSLQPALAKPNMHGMLFTALVFTFGSLASKLFICIDLIVRCMACHMK